TQYPFFRVGVRLLFVALIIGACRLADNSAAAEKKPGNSAGRPAPRKEEWWLKRHDSFVQRSRTGDVEVLFLGDSITHDWEGRGKDIWKERFAPLKAANFGISGDRTEQV